MMFYDPVSNRMFNADPDEFYKVKEESVIEDEETFVEKIERRSYIMKDFIKGLAEGALMGVGLGLLTGLAVLATCKAMDEGIKNWMQIGFCKFFDESGNEITDWNKVCERSKEIKKSYKKK